MEKILVLDLDQTLINTQDEEDLLTLNNILKDPRKLSIRKNLYVLKFLDKYHDQNGKKVKGKWENVIMWGTKRPYLKEFLKYSFDNFKYVIIWSAGASPYVKSIVKEIFKDMPQPPIIYTRSNQTDKTKPLEKMIREIPQLAEVASLKQILVIDDKKYTFENNPENGVLIPPYNPSLDNLDKEDDSLLKLIKWLETPEVKNSTDVRTLDKKNIF